MSQVIIEMGRAHAPDSGTAQVFPARGHVVSEITSSGTAQDGASASPATGCVATVINNGTDAIWVNFAGTAAVGSGHFLSPNTVRDFGPLEMGDIASVINDS